MRQLHKRGALASAGSGFDGEAGPATSARLYLPTGVATDTAGNVLIVDQLNQRIRKLTVGTGSAASIGTFGVAP